MKKSPTQLWLEGSESFGVKMFGKGGPESERLSPHLRALFWPDGKLCWEATAYLINLRKRNLATSTVNTYASELSHFLRLVFNLKILFSEVTDDTFHEYAEKLSNGKIGKPVVRSGDHVNRLILRAIHFLNWLQAIEQPTTKFVGFDGDGANVTVFYRGLKRTRDRLKLRHGSFRPTSIPRVVRPIADDLLAKLFEACASSSRTSFVRARNFAIVKLLADAGIRREELVFVTCESIKEASKNEWRLKIRSAKRAGNPLREVPIPAITGRELMSFLQVQRAILMKRLRKRKIAGSDWLFCSRSGDQLKPSSITQLFALLRRVGAINEPATPHMLRHRWITLQLIAKIREIELGTSISAELLSTLLSRLASLTGHKEIASLWTYVDWSFEDIQSHLVRVRAADQNAEIAAALVALDELRNMIGPSPDIEIMKVLTTVAAALKYKSTISNPRKLGIVD